MIDADVIVVGGGLTGGVLAALLRASGFSVLIVETRSQSAAIDEAPDPRALAVTPASRRILEHIGVWARLPHERVGTFHGMEVWDGDWSEQGRGVIRFSDQSLHEPALGYIIETRVIQQALQAVLDRDAAIGWCRPAAPASLKVEPGHIQLTLEDDRRLTAQLVVAADGQQSRSRRLAGIGYQEMPYPQQALACVVETRQPHGAVARQRFMPDGTLAFLPMAGSHQSGIVWSTTPDHARALLAMSECEFAGVLAEAFEQRLGSITSVGRRGVFPLIKAQAARYCSERFALAGDAAHSIHPLAGQGANMGWLDAACLAEVLGESRADGGADAGSLRLLRRYERWRRGDNRVMQLALDGLYQLFRRPEGPVRLLRGLGLTLTDHSGPVKHLIMRYAMGRIGDLPALVRTDKPAR